MDVLRLNKQASLTKGILEFLWPQWRTFNLGKRLQKRGALEPSTHHYSAEGERFFLLGTLLVARMRPAKIPHSLQSLQMGS